MPPIPSRVPFQDLPLHISRIRGELDAALAAVVTHGRFILGPEVEAFEADWARYCGTAQAIGVGSGTDALQLILRALDIGPGDEVITVANSFIATAEAVSHAGAIPVLVDCLPGTYLIDPEAVASVITHRTKAILPVHLYGQPADMASLEAIARQHHLALLEDAAQAHGARLSDGRRCGALGLAAGFSFYPGKNLGAFGDGGAVTTGDEAIHRRIRLLRNWGSTVKYHHEVQGYNSRLDTLQAAVLQVKRAYLDTWNARRNVLAARYRARLRDLDALELPEVAPWTGEHVYHLFVIRLREHPRSAVVEALKASGIETLVHYPIPIHLQKAYQSLGYRPGAFPVAEEAAQGVLSLPLFPEMTEEQVDVVCEALEASLSTAAKAA